MLVPYPHRISHQELRTLAKKARGRIQHLYLHWSAGRYGQAFDSYHLNIDQNGEIYQTCDQLYDLKAHTWMRNTGSVGISLCCAYGARLDHNGQPLYQGYQPTAAQINQMAMVVALLCYELLLEINFDTVKTHAEAACIDGYGPGQSDPDVRWDLLYLADLPQSRSLRPGGCLLRDRAQRFAKYFDQRALLGAKLPAELANLAA